MLAHEISQSSRKALKVQTLAQPHVCRVSVCGGVSGGGLPVEAMQLSGRKYQSCLLRGKDDEDGDRTHSI